MAEAVIFQHFPSKDALYSAVLELHLDSEGDREWIGAVDACMESNDDLGVFRLFIGRILDSYRQNSEIQRVILFAALEGHEQGLARMHAQFAPVFERFMDYITRRQREGALVDCNPHAIMIGLGGIAHQYGLITQIFRAPSLGISDEEMAQLFTRILLHGVQVTPSAAENDNTNQKPAEPGNRKAKE